MYENFKINVDIQSFSLGSVKYNSDLKCYYFGIVDPCNNL